MSRSLVCAAALMAASVSVIAQQGQPQIGIAPVTLTSSPYVFDTAEQHKIRVTVVVRGLRHPFSLAFLPNGDALVTERGARLRIVRGATGRSRDARRRSRWLACRRADVSDRRLAGGRAASEVRRPTGSSTSPTTRRATVQGGQRRSSVRAPITVARGRFDGKALTDVQELFVGDWKDGASGSRMAFGARRPALHDDRRAVRRSGAER